MTDILNKTIVLVLNRNWQAINIRTPQDAFCQMATNVDFYPVLNEAYAIQIARDWNVKDSGAGYVTRFRGRRDFVTKFQAQTVGDSSHQELWIPAEELTAFNDNIVGEIEVIAEFRK